ncbi:unnamed protein product [Larinioides sclopetarius]|uniref:Uncharacterized protein n=1 Tax=Larinioides sclopetarius TaxID=280406 RepID=A0AAV1YTI3_9ARAC
MDVSSASPQPSCSKTLSKSYPSVLVSNDLMELIQDPYENRNKDASPTPTSLFAHLTTMDELLKHVKNYIVKHKLYDPKNPLKILVDGNELGSLLGKSEFSLLDVRDILLEKFVFPVAQTNPSLSEVICSISDNSCLSKKRKLDNGGGSEFSVKRIKRKREEERDDHTHKLLYESDESMHSFQEYETEFVKDSASDDNFSVNGLIITAETHTFDVDVEYEVESENSYVESDRESDLEDFVKTAVLNFIAETTDSDIEYLADESSDDERESKEKELSEEDKWRCHCGVLNDPVMRCCCACWRMRSGWLPERNISKKRKEKVAQNVERGTRKNKRNKKQFGKGKKERKFSKKFNENKDPPLLSNHKLSPVSDLPCVPTENSQSSSCNGNSPDVKLSGVYIPPCETAGLSSPSTSCNGSSDVFVPPSQSSSNTLEADKNNRIGSLCLLCCARPADCSIIHSKVGCVICCFRCGKRLLAENKRCPTCRRKIERIVYLYHI